jgi:CelD/BcsL family acetyltransferase involved in cellulose biosynthesis
MTAMALQTATAVEAHRSIEPLAQEWAELAQRTDAAPFVYPGWIAAWVDAFGDGAPPLILAARDGDRLAGVLPLIGGRGRLRSPTNTHTPSFDLVAEDGEVARLLVADLFRRGFGQLDLGYMDPGGQLYRCATALGTESAARVLPGALMRSPYVSLEGDLDSFRAGLARNFRRGLDRRRRRLAELGELTFEFIDDVAGGDGDLHHLLDVGFELEASGWKRGEGTAIVSSPRRGQFYRAIAEWASERGWLTLAFARLDGRPISFDFCIEHGGRVYVLKGGYDPEFAKYGVSVLLIEETIARAFDAGHESYELLGDADDYKMQLTDLVRERRHLQAFGRGPGGLARYVGYARVRPLVQRLRGR